MRGAGQQRAGERMESACRSPGATAGSCSSRGRALTGIDECLVEQRALVDEVVAAPARHRGARLQVHDAQQLHQVNMVVGSALLLGLAKRAHDRVVRLRSGGGASARTRTRGSRVRVRKMRSFAPSPLPRPLLHPPLLLPAAAAARKH